MQSSNLKDRIENWKAELSGKLSPDDLDELQSHLEDNINELFGKRIPEDEVWLLAIHRMGSAETIRKEFLKVKDSRVPLVNKLFYWLILIILAMQALNIGRKAISYFLQVRQFPVFNAALILILIVLISWMISKKGRIVKNNLGIFLKTILLICIALCFGFFSDFPGPECHNSNKIFANNPPGSEVYNRELIRVFSKFGTDNLYYRTVLYIHEDGKHYMKVKAIGKGFCVEFPLDITNSKDSQFAHVIKIKGFGYNGLLLKGLKFDLINSKSGVEFIFRDLERIID